MVTIRDYVENNDDIRVRIAQKKTEDPCDSFTETIWEGMLQEIPEQLRGLEVIREGWLIGAQVNQLEVSRKGALICGRSPQSAE